MKNLTRAPASKANFVVSVSQSLALHRALQRLLAFRIQQQV